MREKDSSRKQRAASAGFMKFCPIPPNSIFTIRMAAADVVVCRAGAMTVSEISRCGKCAVFIPSPNVTNNHQYKNAKVLSDDGAALLYEEQALSDGFESDLLRLLSEEGDVERASMEERIGRFAVADANKRIFEDILKLTGKA